MNSCAPILLVLAISVYGAASLTTDNNALAEGEPNFYGNFMAQMRNLLIDTRSLTSPNVACANKYNNATIQIANRLANQTAVCEDKANRTQTTNARNANVTVQNVHRNNMLLERNLQTCKNFSDIQSYLNCTAATFDSNVQILDLSNTLSLQILSEISSNLTINEQQHVNCINAAVSEAKIQSINAANDYNRCVHFIKYQRENNQNKIEPAQIESNGNQLNPIKTSPEKPNPQIQTNQVAANGLYSSAMKFTGGPTNGLKVTTGNLKQPKENLPMMY